MVLKGIATLLVIGFSHFLALFDGSSVEVLSPTVAEGCQQKQIVIDPTDIGDRNRQAEGFSGLATGNGNLIEYGKVAILFGQFLVVLAPLGGEK